LKVIQAAGKPMRGGVGRCRLLGLLYLAAVPQQGHPLRASTRAMKMPRPKTATATNPITTSEGCLQGSALDGSADAQ
jgi:hypothetical protein